MQALTSVLVFLQAAGPGCRRPWNAPGARPFEAYDLTEPVRSAATLTGHDPKTVNPYEREPRPKTIDAFLEKTEEWVERSKATIRADVVHEKLVRMGYRGSHRPGSGIHGR